MNFFSKILTKLGLRKEEAAAPAAPVAPVVAPATPVTPVAKPATVAAPVSTPKPAMDKGEKDDALERLPDAKPAAPVKAAPVAISEVDVVKHLEQLAAGSDYNWKVSIVDLLKILDIDSSREARNELATELGCPAELMSDSAKMNVWLHKEVLKKIAENGGNIPQDLLD